MTTESDDGDDKYIVQHKDGKKWTAEIWVVEGHGEDSANVVRNIERLVVDKAAMLNATGGGGGTIPAIKFMGAVLLLVALGARQRRSRIC